MMSKDRSRAVLAVLVALPLWAAGGAARASDAPSPATVGVGIDYSMQAPAGVAPVGVGSANAIDLLTRPGVHKSPGRLAPQGLVPSLANGLRGLRATNALDSAALAPARSSDEWVTKSRQSKGPMPYVRFSEEERVFGLSFKIQPPPQVPEVAPPSL
jgi:hypothetical protein